jgi:uncharacterized membrane protein YdcZ (DUF606 family)
MNLLISLVQGMLATPSKNNKDLYDYIAIISEGIAISGITLFLLYRLFWKGDYQKNSRNNKEHFWWKWYSI